MFLFYFFLHFVVSSFWRLDVCGRIFVLCNFVFFGRIVVFLAVPYFQAGNFLNLLQVVQAESELGGPGTSA